MNVSCRSCITEQGPPQLRSTWQEKQKEKRQRKLLKDLESQIKGEVHQERREYRELQELRAKQREENAKKNEISQMVLFTILSFLKKISNTFDSDHKCKEIEEDYKEAIAQRTCQKDIKEQRFNERICEKEE